MSVFIASGVTRYCSIISSAAGRASAFGVGAEVVRWRMADAWADRLLGAEGVTDREVIGTGAGATAAVDPDGTTPLEASAISRSSQARCSCRSARWRSNCWSRSAIGDDSEGG